MYQQFFWAIKPLVCSVSEIGAHVLSHCKSAAELALCISSLAHTHTHVYTININ